MKRFKLLVVFYLSTIVALFIYSFTQVDLSLTLSKFLFISSLKIFAKPRIFSAAFVNSDLRHYFNASYKFLFYFSLSNFKEKK